MSNHIKHPTRAAVIARKRDEANERQHRRDKLTTKQQLARLHKRPGESKAERARLEKQTANFDKVAKLAPPVTGKR